MVSKIGSPYIDTENKSSKKKYKKDALEFVDYEGEYKKDPKFKTELCKTFTDTGFCAYGNKCRFAHGKEEMFEKMINHPKYRKSDCMAFHSNGFCNYGQRCHFRHNEMRVLNEIPRSYYTYLINILPQKKVSNFKRLNIFKKITNNLEEITQLFMQTGTSNKKFNDVFINNLKRMINVNEKFDVNLIKQSNKMSQKLYLNSYQKINNERKSSVNSCYSRSPISFNSVSPDDSFLQTQYNYNKDENFATKNLNKKLNFNNYDEIQFFQ
jgi:hypothetical protein